MNTVWTILSWSLRAMFEGKFPHRDHLGNPYPNRSSEHALAGKPLCEEKKQFFSVVWGIKGDLDWFAKGLGLRHYNSMNPCEYCKATRSGTPAIWPTNFAAGAAWKTQMRTAGEWRAELTAGSFALFKEFEFLSMHNLEADELHVLHLGVSMYCIGSVLWLLVYDALPGSPAANFETIWHVVLVEYAKAPGTTEFTSLSISSFIDPEKPFKSYPKLKGRGCEIKSLVSPLLAVLRLHTRPASAIDGHAVVCLECLERMQFLIDETKDREPQAPPIHVRPHLVS